MSVYADVSRNHLNEETLVKWLPGGRRVGREFVAGNLQGDPGESLSVNLETGAWADFATDDKGGDLVSLYAKINGISNSRALAILSGGDHTQFKFRLGTIDPMGVWKYYDDYGREALVVCRYEQPQGKTYRQWTPQPEGGYKPKGLSGTRPLYRSRELSASKGPVLVVEGELAADAAVELRGGRDYSIVTWPGGANAWSRADWSKLRGRDVTLWPDADEPGRMAMVGIKDILIRQGCKVKLIRVQGNDGSDAADWLASGKTWDDLAAWAKPMIERYEPSSGVIPVLPSVNDDYPEDDGRGFPPLHMDHQTLWTACGVQYSQSGVPVCNIDTAGRILRVLKDVGARYRYDEFARRINVDDRPLLDEDAIAFTAFLQGRCGLRSMTHGSALMALQEWARARSFNEPKTWLSSLEWDGVERLEKMMPLVFGTEDTPYARFVGKSMLVSAAARVLNPGCQVDTMVILEGGQGTYKSSALQILGGKWHIESHDEIGSKDFLCSLAGSIIVEIAELESFSKADASRIKRVITARVDRIRKPYGKLYEDHKRTCILVGTTNDDHYLRDGTGARRFLPVRCGQIDRDVLRQIRDQLWAEAVVAMRDGWEWWNMPIAARGEQEKRRRRDPMEDIIRGIVKLQTEVTIADIMVSKLNIEPAQITPAKSAQVQSALQAIGWGPHYEMVDGRLNEVWRKKT